MRRKVILRPNRCPAPFYSLVPKPKDKEEKSRVERGNELQFGNISGRKINSLLNAVAAVARFSRPFSPTVF